MDNKTSKAKLLQTPFRPYESSEGFGKVAPQVLEIEASVLGALLLEKEALSEVVDILKPDVFYTTAHQKIYYAILQLFNQNKAVDLHTLSATLKKEGILEEVGGVSYLVQLTHKIASAAHIETHARLILEYAMRRSLIAISSRIQKDAYDERIDTFDLLDKAEQALFEVAEGNIQKNYLGINALMQEAIVGIENTKAREDGLTGVPSGFFALDQFLCGWQPSDFIVVAARPGMGKSAFLGTILRNAAVDHQKPVALFSLEMSSIQVTNRLIAQEAELSNEKIKKGTLKEYEWQQLYHKTAKLAQAPIYIDDTPGLSLFEFRAKCRRLKARHNISMVIVDYLQLMAGDMQRNKMGGNREQEIAAISRGLKAIAKELNIPIIAASQLSRAVETRGGDKRPQLSDLRESGAIEQDVDIAIFLYRPEYYGITQDENNNPTDQLAEVIIAKHRNGRTGTVNLHFDPLRTAFSDLSQQEQSFVSKANKPF